MHQQAKNYFASLNKLGVYCAYGVPPSLPDAPQSGINGSIEDYSVIFKEPTFDTCWEMQTVARALTYCASEEDQRGAAWRNWFDPQIEALRLSITLYSSLKEAVIFGSIKCNLMQPGVPVFEKFVTEYLKKDIHLTREARATKHWSILYHEINGLFRKTDSLYECYRATRKKAANSRNPKVKDLLWNFSEYIESTLIEKTELRKEVKDITLADLRAGEIRGSKDKYQANRPEVCISDLECAQFLTIITKQFLSSPQRYQTLGETALFIWIYQHAAFSDINLDIQDLPNIYVTDIHAKQPILDSRKGMFPISVGLKKILEAWIGITDRKNERILLPSLNISSLEKTICKYSKSFFGHEGRLKPRDFLGKIHPIPGARLTLEARKLLDSQIEEAKASPYHINTQEIQKQIQETSLKNSSLV